MIRHRQKKSRKLDGYKSPPPSTCAVSVVIAMYNTEKFIGECLDSLLNQTFTNFEVIVIDDCSTDNSAAIVESYAPKFNGRLKLTRLQTNSGSAGAPRNMGLALSRGEYVSFIDDDDTITPTALEELYSIAKDFDADVVACEKYFDVPEKSWYDAEFRRQLKPFSYQRGGFVTEPTLIGEDIAERVKACAQKRFLWNLWSKLIRRDFMIENKITMPFPVHVGEDMLCTCLIVYSAKKLVRVPNAINCYRNRGDSITWRGRAGAAGLQKYTQALKVGFAHLDKFLSGREFFRQHPDVKYLALDTYVREMLGYLQDIYAQIPAPALDELLRKEFGDGDNTALTTFIFSAMNVQRLQFMQAQYQFNQFAAQSNRRIAELEGELKRLKT